MPEIFDVTLRLADIRDLFRESSRTPFDEYYAPYSFKPGIDYIVGELYRHPKAERVNLTVILPPEEITPDLHRQTLNAIQKYSTARAENARQERDKATYKGTRSLVVAGAAFVVLQVVTLLLSQYPGLWIEVLVHGLTIGVWVLLWWPFESLLFERWENRLDERAYRALQNITLTLTPDKPTP